MATYAGLGFSQNDDCLTAAQQAADMAKQNLNKERIDIAFLFNTVHYHPQQFLPVIFKALDNTKIIGSSTSGIILSDGVKNKGIGVLAVFSDDTRFENSHIDHLNLQDTRWIGKALAKNAISDFGQKHRKLFTFFIDGLINNTTDFLSGIKDQLGLTFPIIGAGSSDNLHFDTTHQYYKSQFSTNGATGIMLGGRIHYGIGVRHGFRPLGKPRVATETEGNIIKKINGKKAVTLYEEYFEQEAQTLNNSSLGQINVRYPLGIHLENNQYLLRNVTCILDDGSVVCQDKVAQNSEIHLMIGNKETCCLAAKEAAQQAKDQMKGTRPGFILVFESLFRQKILGRSSSYEIQLIKEVFEGVPVLGMCSHGEIAPMDATSSNPDALFHNSSITVLAVN